jgi:cysteinyl-tRNA synthetase
LRKTEKKARDQRPETGTIDEIGIIKEKFIKAMDDDFNTPEALAAVFEMVGLANKNTDNPVFLDRVRDVLRDLLGIFGLGVHINIILGDEVSIKEEVEVKIEERNEARKNKDYALSDKIRKELEAKGIILEDTKEGTTWRRKL